MYDEVQKMTTDEFRDWRNNLDLKEQINYNAFLYQHLTEGAKFERINFDHWANLEVQDASDVVMYYCRVKPQPKQLKYKPYEKADPKWLGLAVRNKDTKDVSLIVSVSSHVNYLIISDYYKLIALGQMIELYEWYDLNTGETTPFGEAYYEL